MGTQRDDRRKAERAAENRRAEEIERILDEPQLPAFEAPASGTIVERPSSPTPEKPD